MCFILLLLLLLLLVLSLLLVYKENGLFSVCHFCSFDWISCCCVLLDKKTNTPTFSSSLLFKYPQWAYDTLSFYFLSQLELLSNKNISYLVHTCPFPLLPLSSLSSSAVMSMLMSISVAMAATIWIVSKHVICWYHWPSIVHNLIMWHNKSWWCLELQPPIPYRWITITTKLLCYCHWLISSSPLLHDAPSCLSIVLHKFTECMAGQ